MGEPPIVLGNVESALAPITITETRPDALKDGYFTLMHNETPDNPLLFTTNSSVGGSATALTFGFFGGMGAIIQVDADDSRIDTITVQLHAVLKFDPTRNVTVPLMLGEHPVLIPEGGAPTGLGLNEYVPVAIFGGYCCITIGDDSPTLEIAVGESITLPLDHDHPAYVEVSSSQPGIAEVGAVTIDSVEIIGVTPGTALIQAWNPLGHTGYLTVTVTSPTVTSPQEQLILLIDEVEALVPAVLKRGQAQSITSKLRAARAAVERGNGNAARGQLNALENLIHAHRHINPVVANELLAALAAIVDSLPS
ncbi:MAG TPA: hypothetical protein VGE69_07945 [Pseudomonadales bacterium]